jgi:cystathionine beta-lyase
MKLSQEKRRALRGRTRLVHAGRDPSEQFGFINTPIYRGSTVLYPNTAAIFTRDNRFVYGTKGTPTTRSLEEAWSELAGAQTTVLTPSGLAAIVVALMTAAGAGDHILVTDSVYRPTREFCDGVFSRMGVETEYYDPLLGAGVERLMRPNTKVVFVEAPGSHSFEMQDIPAIAAVAHARGACVIMDNTWATPIFFPPHERGVDIAVEAGTKYLSGHSDLLLGLTSANAAWAERLRATFDAMAPCAGPEDCFLALRGLRSMDLRLREAQNGRASPWRNGSPRAPKSHACCTPLCPIMPATLSGNATSPARPACSR